MHYKSILEIIDNMLWNLENSVAQRGCNGHLQPLSNKCAQSENLDIF